MKNNKRGDGVPERQKKRCSNAGEEKTTIRGSAEDI